MKLAKPQVILGFLSVLEEAATGAVGGLLLLNSHGRPLELHCSVPVRVNRAQALLYGESLRPQLFGHTIAAALFAAVTQAPAFVVTDCLDMLAFREISDIPLVYVAGASAELPGAAGDDEVAGCRLLAAPHHRSDVATIQQIWQALHATVELQEPFQRLREALREMTSSAGMGNAAQAA